MKIAALLIALLAILGVALYAAAEAFAKGGINLGLHGWIALILGVVLSLAVGVGLMGLVFYSARHGFDDQQRRDDP